MIVPAQHGAQTGTTRWWSKPGSGASQEIHGPNMSAFGKTAATGASSTIPNVNRTMTTAREHMNLRIGDHSIELPSPMCTAATPATDRKGTDLLELWRNLEVADGFVHSLLMTRIMAMAAMSLAWSRCSKQKGTAARTERTSEHTSTLPDLI